MLIGGKNVAWFDLWSFQHFATGFVLGDLLQRRKVNIIHTFIVAVFAAYVWELLEYYLEIGVFGNILMHWFGGVEFVWNRLFIDPALFVLGAILGHRLESNFFRLVALVFCFLWLFSNVLFDSSNQLQMLMYQLF